MKKLFAIVLLVMFVTSMVIAQENDNEISGAAPSGAESSSGSRNILGISLGAIIEANMNSAEGYAMGIGFAGSYMLPDFMPIGRAAAGIKALFSMNFSDLNSIEVGATFRWYLLRVQAAPDSGLFAEAALGSTIAWSDEQTKAYFLGGLNAGFRYFFGNIFAEAYLRFGYPYFWGIGAGAGYRL
ncbi:hypothetical protein K7I13_04855 [Brucepastera parasyntrophica]|uniref:hypothetical protein n=1 Tax=Brucepastera parasyntrophica TaxID=2880008 RepID=UPI00210B7890|nr:hypothetical protein [Brucepastera parasyntrophica]ULQ60613.1 hypothetical protein K7I13_04855 [Brucepastera parasyntrophica]